MAAAWELGWNGDDAGEYRQVRPRGIAGSRACSEAVTPEPCRGLDLFQPEQVRAVGCSACFRGALCGKGPLAMFQCVRVTPRRNGHFSSIQTPDATREGQGLASANQNEQPWAV